MARVPKSVAGPDHPKIIEERANSARRAVYLASPEFRKLQAYLAAVSRSRKPVLPATATVGR
jgi:hypothetical protein